MRKRLPTLGRERAMKLAFRLLARRARSEAEIAAALEEGGASRTVARAVLGRLRALGYLDDRKLAAECAERWQSRGFGSLRVRDQLRRLRVEERVADGVAPDPGEERERARQVLARYFTESDLGDRRGLSRAARFLAGRGFPPQIIDSLFDLWE